MKSACIRVLSALCFLLIFSACGDNNNQNTTQSHPAFQLPEVQAMTSRINKDPQNARLWFQRGLVLQQLRHDTLALNDFKKAVSLDSTKAEYFSAIGDLMFEHQDIDGSVAWIEKAVKLNPDDPTARLKIAKMMIFMKDYPKAFSEINTVLRQNAMVPEGYFLKGIIYKELKDTAKAISSFQTAVQVDPDYRDAIIQLGTIHSSKKDPIALQYFNNAFRLDTTDVFPLYARGMYYQQLGEYEKAKEEYRKSIHYNSDYINSFFATGWILLQQDSLEKAWRQFDIVTKLEPTDAEAYYNRGLASELMGKTQDALADYKQAVIFDETYKEAQEGVRRLSGK